MGFFSQPIIILSFILVLKNNAYDVQMNDRGVRDDRSNLTYGMFRCIDITKWNTDFLCYIGRVHLARWLIVVYFFRCWFGPFFSCPLGSFERSSHGLFNRLNSFRCTVVCKSSFVQWCTVEVFFMPRGCFSWRSIVFWNLYSINSENYLNLSLIVDFRIKK